MLTQGESYDTRKAFILDCIKVSRGLIITLGHTAEKHPSLKSETLEVIQLEKQYLNSQMDELTRLARWKTEKGLANGEPYQLVSRPDSKLR